MADDHTRITRSQMRGTDSNISDISAIRSPSTTINMSGDDGHGDIETLCQEIRGLKIMCQDIKDTLSNKIQQSQNEMIKRINEMDTSFSRDISVINTRIDNVESQVQDMVAGDNYNPDRTLVVTKLNEEPGSTVFDQAQALVRDGLGLATQVVRAKRLQGRNGNPGIVKVELPSLEKKVEALRRKPNLQSQRRYERVYVRSSQSHEERVAQSNLKVIVDAIPELRGRYRFAGNGRIVDKTVGHQPHQSHMATPTSVPIGGTTLQHHGHPPPPPTQRPQHTDPRYQLPPPAMMPNRQRSPVTNSGGSPALRPTAPNPT